MRSNLSSPVLGMVLLGAVIGASSGLSCASTADFDLRNNLVPKHRILSGGPPRDGIPAILEPKFATVENTGGFLKDTDRVLALTLDGVSKAYPVKILNWHELVNDHFNGRPVIITFCPLCGTGMIFDRLFDGKEYTFGVSGLLYKSDVLLYDHQTESLWSQIAGKAVTGKMSGTKLKLLPAVNTTWGRWKRERPDTLALTTDTGYKRDYSVDPFDSYKATDRVMFPMLEMDQRFNNKETVIGISLNGDTKAYPFSLLKKAEPPIKDTVGGVSILVHFDKDSSTAYITGADGARLPATVGFWFAWYAFNPDTKVWGE